MADRSVSVSLRANVAGFVAGMKTAQGSVSSFTKELETNAKRKQALLSVGNAAGIMGAAAAAGVGVAIKAAADFDKSMSGVEAATHASSRAMESLRAAALKAGADTAFSATEAAGGIEALSKAGVSVQDVLHGGLRGALSLAAAGEMEVGDAAEAAATAMTMFALKGKDVPHVADLLAAAAGKAQGEVSDFAMALNQSGLVAHQTGLSIEETTGALGAFASQGLIGSDAGTSLKTMLMSLTPSSTKAKEAIDQYNISAYDQQGRFIGLEEWAGKLRAGLSNMSDEQRNATLKTVFGSDAVRAASVIYEQGAGGIDKWITKVNDQGFAAETAAIKLDNLSGDLEAFKGSLETALIGIGEGGMGPLRSMTQTATKAVNAFNDLPAPVKQATLAFGGLVAVTGGAAFLGSRFIAAIADGRTALRDLGITSATTGEKVGLMRRGFGGVMGLLGGPWGIALAAGAAGLGIFLDAQHDAQEEVDHLTTSLNKQTGAVTRNTAKQVINAAQKDGLFERAQRLGISEETLTRALLGQGDAISVVNRRLNASIEANRGLSSSGVMVTETTHGLGLQAQFLKDKLESQNGELAEARTKWKQDRDAQQLAQRAMKATKDVWDDSTKSVRGFHNEVDKVPDKHTTKIDADTEGAKRDVSSFTSFFKGSLDSIKDEDVKINVDSSILQLAMQGQGPIQKATGGPISGGIAGKDSVHSLLMPGEHVFTKSDVDKAGGQRAMFAIRKMIQRGEFAKKGDLQYMASGGPVMRMPVREHGIEHVVDVAQAQADALSALVGKRLSDRITQMYQFGGNGRPLGPGGTLSMGQALKGQQFAQTQAGKPYQWGGTGNPSWDCSGFVGGVLLASLGQSPYHRIGSTASMPWPGFSPGAGIFTTGTDPGSHMDGNVGGMGIESRGGDGIVLGGGITPISSFARMDHYDNGGVWKSGAVGMNTSGRDELVLNNEQARRFFGSPGGGRGSSSSSRGPVRVVVDLGEGMKLRGMMYDAAETIADGRDAHSRRMAGMR